VKHPGSVYRLHAVLAGPDFASTVLTCPLLDRLPISGAHLDVLTDECLHTGLEFPDEVAVRSMKDQILGTGDSLAIEHVAPWPRTHPVKVGGVILLEQQQTPTEGWVGLRDTVKPLCLTVIATESSTAVRQSLDQLHVEAAVSWTSDKRQGIVDLLVRGSRRDSPGSRLLRFGPGPERVIGFGT
jgi:hypothetical protein